MNAQQKQPVTDTPLRMQTETLIREIWLHYFNRTLYEKGLISETEMRKIRRMISK